MALGVLLQKAKPGWSPQDLAAAERKLAKVGVDTIELLAEALDDDLNDRLRRAGLQAFKHETLQAMRDKLEGGSLSDDAGLPTMPPLGASLLRPGHATGAARQTASSQAVRDKMGADIPSEDPGSRATPTLESSQLHPDHGTRSAGQSAPSQVAKAAAAMAKSSIPAGIAFQSRPIQLTAKFADSPGKPRFTATATKDAKVNSMGFSKVGGKGLVIKPIQALMKGKGAAPPGGGLSAALGGRGMQSRQLPGQEETPALLVGWDGWSMPRESHAEALSPTNIPVDGGAEMAWLQEEEDDEDEYEAPSEEEMADLSSTCKMRGVPIDTFEQPKKAALLLKELQRLERSPASTLKNEYKVRGFAPAPGMSKQELLSRMKEVLIWQRLQLEELREVCASRVQEAKSVSLAEMSRGALLRLLADASWNARGIPVWRFDNRTVAHGVLDSVDSAMQRSLADVIAQCKRLGVPVETQPRKEQLISRLRQAMVWKQLPLAELRLECEMRGLPSNVFEGVESPGKKKPIAWGSKMPSSDGKKERTVVEKSLIHSLWVDVWADAGISLSRLGSYEAAERLFREVTTYRGMDAAELSKRFKSKASGAAGQQQGMSHEDLVDRLCDISFWEALPIHKLRAVGRECGVLQALDEEVEDAEENKEERHKLTQELIAKACAKALEAKGIPVKRIGDLQVSAKLAERWKDLDSLSDDKLRERCAERGVPDLNSQESRALLREVLVWEALPLVELQQQASSKRTTEVMSGHEEEQRRRLVDLLLIERCSAVYEEKGIPVGLLGSLRSAASLASRWDSLQRMSIEALEGEYEALGLPPSTSSENAQREELLQSLRDVALWEALPLPELRLTCRSRSVEVPADAARGNEARQRGLLVDALLVSLCEESYKEKGIPIKQLGSPQAAARLAEKWGKLADMSTADLLLKASAFGVPAEEGIKTDELASRVRKAMLWSEMPLSELQKECRLHKVNSIARESEHRELVRRLATTVWTPKPSPRVPPPPPPPPSGWQQQQQRPPPGGQRQTRPPPSKTSSSMSLAGHFRTLELPTNATIDQIKKAYRRLALKYHPDKNSGEEAEQTAKFFREVAEAYTALTAAKLAGRAV